MEILGFLCSFSKALIITGQTNGSCFSSILDLFLVFDIVQSRASETISKVIDF